MENDEEIWSSHIVCCGVVSICWNARWFLRWKSGGTLSNTVISRQYLSQIDVFLSRYIWLTITWDWHCCSDGKIYTYTMWCTCKTIVDLFDLGLTSLSTIFQSYRDGVWMWQGAQCSLLECCLTEISRPRHWHDIPPSHIILSWPVLALLS